MTKKNYIQTIKSHNPQRLFTFSDINSFISYNGIEIEGAIFDENTNALMTPVLSYLRNAPKTINLFGPSVIANEIANQSLAISGTGDAPYNVAYTSTAPTTISTAGSTFSVQLRVPNQTMNNETVIKQYSTPIGKIITDTGIIASIESVLHADYWYLPITNQIDWTGVKTFTVEVIYKGELIHFDTYHIEMEAAYVERFINRNNIFNTPSNSSILPVFNSVMPQLPNTAVGESADFKWAYGNDGTKPVYMINATEVDIDGNVVPIKVIYGVNDIVFYGTIKESIDILEHRANTLGTNSTANKTTDIISCGGFKISSYYDNGLKLLITHSYPNTSGITTIDYTRLLNINVDTSYTIVLTKEKTDSGFMMKGYLNGANIFNVNTNGTNNISNSDIRIGSNDAIKTISYGTGAVKNWDQTYLTYYHNSITVFIDNISVITKVLTARDVYIMYIRTMTYLQLLLSFDPSFHVVFDKPQLSYANVYSSDRLEVNNFSISSVDINSEVYTKGTRFKGVGSLIHKTANTNYNDTTSLVNFSNVFSMVFWLKTSTRNFLLYSECNKSTPENGLSIFVEDGYITYRYGDKKHKTNCYISDDRFKMLGVSYDGNNLLTFIPNVHNSTYPAILSENSISQRYVTLLNDKGVDENVDVTICAFSTFETVLKTQQFTDLYNESIDFSVVGTVLYENLPASSQVRIIEHSSGKLLEVQYTDQQGRFKYTSIYKNDIDIVTLNNGRLQVVGTIQSTTR